MQRTIFALTAVLTLALGACGNDDTTAPQGQASTPASTPSSSPTTAAPGDAEVGAQAIVSLAAQNDSGITGSATLVQTAPGKVTVTVTLTGGGAGPQPMHIHPGPCAQLDPAPKYPLQNVTDGKSTTEIDVGLNTLLDGSFAINVHKSPSEAQIYVACGDIARS